MRNNLLLCRVLLSVLFVCYLIVVINAFYYFGTANTIFLLFNSISAPLIIVGFIKSFTSRFFYRFTFTILAFFFSLEVITYLLICGGGGVLKTNTTFFYGGLGATNKPFAQYDSIAGYKAIPGKFRIINIQGKHTVYDHVCTVNQQGYYSAHDFQLKKSKKRYLVFGDSFSAGQVVPVPWCEVLNKKFEEAGDSIELYNFCMDGTGIYNWYSQFFKEARYYEYDGVILALYGGNIISSADLSRDFFIQHSLTDRTALNFFKTVPINETDFAQNYLPKLFDVCDVMNDEDINKEVDRIIGNNSKSFVWQKPDTYFIKLFFSLTGNLYKFYKLYRTVNKDEQQITSAQVNKDNYYAGMQKRYGRQKIDMLDGIVNHCIKNDKQVILINIPDKGLLNNASLKVENLYTKELALYANEKGALHINGYGYFTNRADKQIDSFFYNYDGHWNQNGANHFAQCLYNDLH